MMSKLETLEKQDELIDIMLDRMITFCKFFFKPTADSEFQLYYVEYVESIFDQVIKIIDN